MDYDDPGRNEEGEERRPPEPAPIEGLPRLRSKKATALLIGRGQRLAVADGVTVALFQLIWRQDRDGDRFVAELEFQHTHKDPVTALAEGPAGLLIVATVGDNRTRLQVIDGSEIRPLAVLEGAATDLAIARRTAIVVLRAEGRSGARVDQVDLRSGQVRSVDELPVSDSDPQLTVSARGDIAIVADPALRQLWRVRLQRDCDDGTREPPRRPDPRRPDPDRPSGHPTDRPKPHHCGCHPTEDDRPPGGGADPGGSRPPGDNDPDCRPGGDWVPGDCYDWLASGHMVIRRSRCDEREPDCKTRLDYQPAALRLLGRWLVATDAGGRRMTVLDTADLRILSERSFGRAGALIVTGEATSRVLAYRRDTGNWQIVSLARAFLPALDLRQPLPAESMTFYGHNPDGIPPAPDPQTGLKRVLCVPVIEPGQSFTDPNVANFGAFMGPNSFDIVNAYYDEASFGLIDIRIDLFGRDAGPTGAPVQMPNPFRSYFWPPFKAGGLVATETGGTPYEVRLDGTEALTLRVDPRKGSTDDLTVPFAALSLAESYNLFPVTLNFNGSETATLEVETGAGANFTLQLQFPAESITIQPGDVAQRLADLASYLDGVIQAAESAAGVPGGSPLFEPAEVWRVRLPGQDFGSLEIGLRLRPAGSGKGQVTVTAQSGLNMIGFDNALSGRFSLPTDRPLLDLYLTRALGQAETDAGFDFSTRRIETVDVAFAGGTVTITLGIEASIGGDGAVITVQNQSGVQSLGFDNAVADPGVSDPNSANALKESQAFMDDFFTAIVDRLGGSVPAGFFDPYVSVLVGFVGAPPSGEWGASQPDISGLRMFTRNLTAKYLPNDSIQLQSRYIGTIFDATPDNATLAHELGHALGLPDLYFQEGYRDDLQYLNDWAMMDNHGDMPHFCGYHKYVLGWIPDTRVVPVPLPNPSSPTVEEALLVPVEYWDGGMEAAVAAEFGNELPVAQLMSINLGGDGVQFDLVEARQEGVQFSQSLPAQPALIVTNAIDVKDDTRYAEANLYRRKIHLLNTGSDLLAAGDEFDLAAAPELAAVGVSVEVVEVRTVMRPLGSVQVFHTRVRREQADYVDLCFTETTPNYKSVDVWVDWAGDNTSDDPEDHRVYPEGEPIDQGETVHYPSSGTELHWVVGRIHNRGTAPARDVLVRASKWDPPGAGDTGNKAEFRSGTIEEVPAGGFVTLPLKWDVGAAENQHQCLRLDIADWSLPEDPVDAIALASDDVWLSNNWAQQNVFDFVALGSSPYVPISFNFSVTNDGVSPERAYLEPEGLAPGMKLTVTPRIATIQPKQTFIFRCLLELDEKVIDTGCRNDRAFVLWAWRETDEAFERWGGCKYTVRPRKRVMIELSGWWSFDGRIPVSGAVVPDPGQGSVLLRSAFDGGEGRWQEVPLQAGGTFAIELEAGDRESVELVAHYEGSADFGPAYSEILVLTRPKPIG